jgi:predicted TIM-barrel fold metal-dependent hydrolase
LIVCSCIDQIERNNSRNITNGSDATSNRPLRRIDTHHHIVPDFFRTAIEEAGGDPSGGPNPKWSVEQAKEHMSKIGIETVITSITAPGAMIYENNKEKGRDFARKLNEFSANLAKNYPKEFGYFASLPPLTDVEGTLNEIDYVHSTLKPDGYILFTSYGRNCDLYLGQPSFKPIWAKLDELKTIVFIHPSQAPTTLVNRYLLPPLIDFPQETTRTAADLVVTGTRAKFPDVKIILSHGGGTLPFIAYRISLAGLAPGTHCPRNHLEIIEDFRSFYFDTALSASPPQLQALLQFADPSKILFGSDIPYLPFPAVDHITKRLDNFFLNKSDQYEKMWRAINHENAKLLFPNKVKD